MKNEIVIDDILVNLEYESEGSSRTCFVVFSSHENHVEIVIDCVESVFKDIGLYEVRRLDKHLKSGDSQYSELRDLLASCCFGVVILDGFRPNILFEYGILKGLNKPCIVLVEENATVDIHSFFATREDCALSAPSINMDRHFSDVKDRFYVQYKKNDPKQLREKLKEEYSKLKETIEQEFFHMLVPDRDIVERELSSHLAEIVNVFNKDPKSIVDTDLVAVSLASEHITRIAGDASVELPFRFYKTLSEIHNNAGDTEQAVKVLETAKKGTREDMPLLAQKSFILRKSEMFDEALDALDEALALVPKNESLWHNKALTLMQCDRRDEAAGCYKKAVSLNKGCSHVHFHYGILLYEKEEYGKALYQFNAALRLRPSAPEFQCWKAKALIETNKHVAARRLLDETTKNNPTYADAWFLLGGVEDDSEKSLEYYEKALEHNELHSGALCSAAAQTSNLGNPKKAYAMLSRARKICSEKESCATLAINSYNMLQLMGKQDEALAALEDYVSLAPSNAKSLHKVGVKLAYSGQLESALHVLHTLVKFDPEKGAFWYDMACVYAMKGNCRDAVRNLKTAILTEPRFEDMAKNEEDFENIKESKSFQRLVYSSK